MPLFPTSPHDSLPLLRQGGYPRKIPRFSRFSAHLAIVFSLPAERVSFRGSACHLSDRFHVCANYTCVNIISFSLFCKDLFYISPRKKPGLQRVQTGSSRSYSRFVSKEKELLCPGAFPSPGQLYPTAAPSRSVERTLKPLLQLYEYRNFPHFFRLVRIE